MSTIRGYVDELQKLKNEKRERLSKLKIINQRIKHLESEITIYLESKDQTGMKYQNMALILQDKIKHAPKKEKERESDIIRILDSYGIREPEQALKEINNARRGEEAKIKQLKISKIK